MIVLFDHAEPALLVHGGRLTQIQQTKAALEALGCQVDYLRWWDETQRADILHYFGRMPPSLLRAAQAKGIKVVLGGIIRGARLASRVAVVVGSAKPRGGCGRLLPGRFTAAFRWEAHRLADAHIVLTPWEAHVLNRLYQAPKEKIHVIAERRGKRLSGKPPGKPWSVAGLHRHDHRAQASLGAGSGCRSGADTALGHRQGLFEKRTPTRKGSSRWPKRSRGFCGLKGQSWIGSSWRKSIAKAGVLFC